MSDLISREEAIQVINDLLDIYVPNESQYDSGAEDNCKKIIETREYTTQELKKLGFDVLSSSANFIFAKKDGISGEEVYKKLRQNGVLVRHFTKDAIKDYNRITFGTYEEMKRFIEIVTGFIK